MEILSRKPEQIELEDLKKDIEEEPVEETKIDISVSHEDKENENEIQLSDISKNTYKDRESLTQNIREWANTLGLE